MVRPTFSMQRRGPPPREAWPAVRCKADPMELSRKRVEGERVPSERTINRILACHGQLWPRPLRCKMDSYRRCEPSTVTLPAGRDKRAASEAGGPLPVCRSSYGAMLLLLMAMLECSSSQTLVTFR